MDILSHCFMRVLWCLYHVWQGESSHKQKHDLQLHQRHAQLLHWVLKTKSLNNVPHQWCSGPRMLIHVWICYSTVLWVLYETWTTYDRGESPHRPHHNSNYTKNMLSCYTAGFQKQRAWIMYLISGVVVQGCWYMYGYAILLYYECYMRYGSHLVGVNHQIDHIMTFNYNLGMLSCYPCF